jgi:hypothetical protein
LRKVDLGTGSRGNPKGPAITTRETTIRTLLVWDVAAKSAGTHTARGGPVAFPSLLGSSRPLSDHRALPSSSAEVKAAVVPEPGRTYSRTNDIAGQGRDLRDCCLRAAFACAAGCRVDTMVSRTAAATCRPSFRSSTGLLVINSFPASTIVRCDGSSAPTRLHSKASVFGFLAKPSCPSGKSLPQAVRL